MRKSAARQRGDCERIFVVSSRMSHTKANAPSTVFFVFVGSGGVGGGGVVGVVGARAFVSVVGAASAPEAVGAGNEAGRSSSGSFSGTSKVATHYG